VPFPPLLLLLLAGGAVAVAAAGTKKKQPPGEPYKLAPTRRGAVYTGPVPGVAVPYPPEKLFGERTATDFPAPYRHMDARKIADVVLNAASMTAPIWKPHYETIRDRSKAIEASNLPNAYKVYALINTVVIPAYATSLMWHWYRKGGKSPHRKKMFNAIGAWAFMFNAMPVTAMAHARIKDPDALLGAGSFTLDEWADYFNPFKLTGDLNPRQIRGLLNDVMWYMILRPRQDEPEDEYVQELERLAEGRMDSWYQAYPWEAGEERIIEGNFALVEEMLWLANVHVEDEIKVDFDEEAAWVALFVNVLAAAASAVGGFVSPAVAAAITAAVSLISGIASAFVEGKVTRQQVQALTGSSVAFALESAGIDLGLGGELEQLADIVGEQTGAA